ncbi:major facilitator superfamily domain-containing protein [Aspergillus unguis]
MEDTIEVAPQQAKTANEETQVQSSQREPTAIELLEIAGERLPVNSAVIDFEGPDDELDPHNWTVKKKVFTFFLVSFATMVVSMTSSIFSTVIPVLEKTYDIGKVVCSLGIAVYVLGFATGPLIWAPISEIFGRRIPYMLSMLGFTLFAFGTAASNNIVAVFVCRFFAGFFGACPFTLSGAICSDMLSPQAFTFSMVGFGITVFSGPLLAPMIGGFIVMNENLGWRWTHYLAGILGVVSFVSVFLFLDESYHPSILVWKARNLRRDTGNRDIHAKHEEVKLNVKTIIRDYLTIPLKLLGRDLIILCVCVFGAFVYGLLYLFLTAYPVIFQGVHGMNPGVGGIPFIAVIIGQILAGILMYLRQLTLTRKMQENINELVPEWLLLAAIPGSAAFAAGLLWLGWSGYSPATHWIVPTLSGILTGFGLITMFLPSVQYVALVRRNRAASALAAHTFLRSLAGSCFPLFAPDMFKTLGVQWSLTLLGCIAACMIPIPVFLYIYGARMRAMSRLQL